MLTRFFHDGDTTKDFTSGTNKDNNGNSTDHNNKAETTPITPFPAKRGIGVSIRKRSPSRPVSGFWLDYRIESRPIAGSRVAHCRRGSTKLQLLFRSKYKLRHNLVGSQKKKNKLPLRASNGHFKIELSDPSPFFGSEPFQLSPCKFTCARAPATIAADAARHLERAQKLSRQRQRQQNDERTARAYRVTSAQKCIATPCFAQATTKRWRLPSLCDVWWIRRGLS